MSTRTTASDSRLTTSPPVPWQTIAPKPPAPDESTRSPDGVDPAVGDFDPSPKDDTLAGTGGDDLISGWGGNDTIGGSGGHDSLYGGWGEDLLIGGAGDDYLSGGADADELQGGIGNDTLAGGGGDDLLNGGADDDLLLGGSGHDTLDGGSGNNTLAGGTGNDTYVVAGAGSNTIIEQADKGVDRVEFVGPNDGYLDYTLPDNVENLTVTQGGGGTFHGNGLANHMAAEGSGGVHLFGESGDDHLRSAGGSDELRGGTGDDTLWGRAGNDTLWGDDGQDDFVYAFTAPGAHTGAAGFDGHDTIRDFAPGDRLILDDRSNLIATATEFDLYFALTNDGFGNTTLHFDFDYDGIDEGSIELLDVGNYDSLQDLAADYQVEFFVGEYGVPDSVPIDLILV